VIVRVRVPATAANLGPGFDVLGLALELMNEIEAEPLDSGGSDVTAVPGAGPDTGGWRVTVAGEGADELAADESNLTVQGMKRAAQAAGRTLQPCRVTCENRIPVGRGLGSSSAAIVGGLVAGNALMGEPLTREALLAEAARMEGHGDNVAAALFGGFTVFYETEEGPRALALQPAEDLTAVVVVPPVALATTEARAVLPKALTYEDATFQMARVALMAVAVTTGRAELFAEAAADRMHQPQRRPFEPGYGQAETALRDAGALGVSLSGAGPAVLGWARRADAAAVRERAASLLGEGQPDRPRVLALDINTRGTVADTDTGTVLR
jgi:homoserine kinase